VVSIVMEEYVKKIKKKNCIVITILIFASIIMMYVFEREKEEIRTEYLIDIWIENKQDIDIIYIQMGIILNGTEKKIINTLEGNYVKNKKMHFTINYSPETQLFLRGVATTKNIEECYFDLKEYFNTKEKQEIIFYIDNYKIHKCEKDIDG
jgi:hypothetical protein